MLGFHAIGTFPLGCIYVVEDVVLNGIVVAMNLSLETQWVSVFGIMQNSTNAQALQCVSSMTPGIMTTLAFPANLRLIVSSTEVI